MTAPFSSRIAKVIVLALIACVIAGTVGSSSLDGWKFREPPSKGGKK